MPPKRVRGTNGGPFDYTGGASEERAILARELMEDADSPEPPNFGHVVTSFAKDPRSTKPKTRNRVKLTPEIIHNIGLLVAGGTPIPTACTAVGAGKAYAGWNERGRAAERAGMEPGFGEGESPELAWLLEMDQAKAAFEASMVARIGAAAVTSWQAAAWLLERRAPRRWFPKHQLNITAGGKKEASLEIMSTKALIEIAKGILPDHSEIKVFPSEFNHDSDEPRLVVEAEIEEGD